LHSIPNDKGRIYMNTNLGKVGEKLQLQVHVKVKLKSMMKKGIVHKDEHEVETFKIMFIS
jgi:hypothetical protein